MKTFKRILSAVLSLIITLSVCAFSASAASQDAASYFPEFQVEVISETSSTAVVALKIVKGNVLALDVTFNISGNVKACTKIAKSAEFKAFSDKLDEEGKMPPTFVQNAATVMISLASTVPVQDVSICEYTLSKSNSNKITSSDINAVITNSVSQSSSKTDVITTAEAKISFAGAPTPSGPIEFADATVDILFKSKKKLNYTSTYKEDEIEFKSSNEKVVSVDEKGNVTATGLMGSATITATSKDGKATAQCKVNVSCAWWQWVIIIVLFGWLWYI